MKDILKRIWERIEKQSRKDKPKTIIKDSYANYIAKKRWGPFIKKGF